METVVIGCGRVGLPTGLALALTGHSVTFVDVDRVRLAALASGRTPFIESGQGQALLAVRKRARFTTDLRQALSGGEVAFVTVDTPGGPEERGETGASQPAPIMWTSPESAEMAKLAANAFLAARISLINEVANICELVGADVADVVRVVGSDPRLGPHYLQAGLGFGGSCLPKDLNLLVRVAGDAGYDPILAQAVAAVNEGQGKRLLGRLERLLGEEGLPCPPHAPADRR